MFIGNGISFLVKIKRRHLFFSSNLLLYYLNTFHKIVRHLLLHIVFAWLPLQTVVISFNTTVDSWWGWANIGSILSCVVWPAPIWYSSSTFKSVLPSLKCLNLYISFSLDLAINFFSNLYHLIQYSRLKVAESNS